MEAVTKSHWPNSAEENPASVLQWNTAAGQRQVLPGLLLLLYMGFLDRGHKLVQYVTKDWPNLKAVQKYFMFILFLNRCCWGWCFPHHGSSMSFAGALDLETDKTPKGQVINLRDEGSLSDGWHTRETQPWLDVIIIISPVGQTQLNISYGISCLLFVQTVVEIIHLFIDKPFLQYVVPISSDVFLSRLPPLWGSFCAFLKSYFRIKVLMRRGSCLNLEDYGSFAASEAPVCLHYWGSNVDRTGAEPQFDGDYLRSLCLCHTTLLILTQTTFWLLLIKAHGGWRIPFISFHVCLHPSCWIHGLFESAARCGSGVGPIRRLSPCVREGHYVFGKQRRNHCDGFKDGIVGWRRSNHSVWDRLKRPVV